MKIFVLIAIKIKRTTLTLPTQKCIHSPDAFVRYLQDVPFPRVYF